MIFVAKRDGSEIEAFKWTGGADQEDEPDWIVAKLRSGEAELHDVPSPNVTMSIRNENVVRVAKPGDWIVRDEAGRVYPFSPEIFESHFEPEDEPFSGNL